MTENLNKQEVDMLREELEMLMAERSGLLRVVGAAAVLVANTEVQSLPLEAAEAYRLQHQREGGEGDAERLGSGWMNGVKRLPVSYR